MNVLHTVPKGKSTLETPGRFACVKAHKRLWIGQVTPCDTLVNLLYTHPDFLRPQDRGLMQTLAEAANRRGRLDILDIVLFECLTPRAKGCSPRGNTPITPFGDMAATVDLFQTHDSKGILSLIVNTKDATPSV